jgi:hypothetical protein
MDLPNQVLACQDVMLTDTDLLGFTLSGCIHSLIPESNRKYHLTLQY